MRLRQHHLQQGFTLVELLVATVILGVLGAIAAPNMRDWSQGYYLQSALTNLYSHMQMAKLGAVKDSQPWTITFTPDERPGYEIRNSAGRVIRTVDFRTQYGDSIQFSSPSTEYATAATLTFNANGTSSIGFGYLSDKDRSGYHRVGVQLASGTIRVQKWNGSVWK